MGSLDYISYDTYYEGCGESIVIRINQGEEIEHLQYRAEGSGFVRWRGLVLDVPTLPWLLSFSKPKWRVVVEPITESWVRVTHPVTGDKGWVLADETLIVTDREF